MQLHPQRYKNCVRNYLCLRSNMKLEACTFAGRARISGWGHLKKLEILDNSHVAYADELQVAEVNLYSLNQCDNILSRGFEARKKKEKFKLHENTFCAGHLNKT